MDFIDNPRRHPRIPVRCAARIAVRGGAFVGTVTFDLGPRGCGLEGARRFTAGEKAYVELREPSIFGAHFLSGRVVWASSAAPWRCGVEFDPGSARTAATLYDHLVRARPDRARGEPFVERIPADALLTPTPAPGTLGVVSVEAEVLSALGAGADARTLRERLGDRWGPCMNALFALLGRGVIAVDRSGSWRGGGRRVTPRRAGRRRRAAGSGRGCPRSSPGTCRG